MNRAYCDVVGELRRGGLDVGGGDPAGRVVGDVRRVVAAQVRTRELGRPQLVVALLGLARARVGLAKVRDQLVGNVTLQRGQPGRASPARARRRAPDRTRSRCGARTRGVRRARTSAARRRCRRRPCPRAAPRAAACRGRGRGCRGRSRRRATTRRRRGTRAAPAPAARDRDGTSATPRPAPCARCRYSAGRRGCRRQRREVLRHERAQRDRIDVADEHEHEVARVVEPLTVDAEALSVSRKSRSALGSWRTLFWYSSSSTASSNATSTLLRASATRSGRLAFHVAIARSSTRGHAAILR